MKNRFRIFLVLSLLYALFIFYLSSNSSLGNPRTILGFFHFEYIRSLLKPIESSDLRFLLYPLSIFSKYPAKVGHVVLYAGFGFLLYLTLRNSSNPALGKYAFMFAIFIGTFYGATDELHQYFVPGRDAGIEDVFIDGGGVALAQAIIFMRERLFKRKPPASNLDLKLILILAILSIIFILIPPFNQTFLRMLLALPLLLFLSGYLLMAVMFPKRGELSAIERFTLSIGFSIAITVFDGFALNYTKWGFRPNSIVLSLSAIIVLLLIIAYFQRWRLEDAGYGFSFRDITAFYNTIRSKETETGPEYDPALEKTLIKTMVIAILIVGAMLIYAKITTEPEKFTALYILGANGKAEDYPTELRIGEPATILVGVENYEYAPINYTLAVKLGDRMLKEQYIALDNGNKWLDNVTFIPKLTSSIAFAGANKSKLEFQLLKDNQPYREVHLLVNISLDSVKFASLPDLINGDMESNMGWSFSGSSPNITGNYTNNTGNSSSRAYEINFTTEAARDYGTIYQNLTTNGDARAILSFDDRDSEYSNTSYYIFKQALIDENVVWEYGIGGENSSWEHVEVPVLLSGNNTLAFRVYSKYTTSDNVTVWWDNVQLKPYGENNTQTKRLPPKVYEFKFDVRGAPLMLAKSMKIDGFSFPGFNYNLSGNKSYEELSLLLSDNNQIDAGNATYTSRGNGSDLYLMGSRYRILGKDMPTNLSRLVGTYANKTLTLGEAWNLGDTYSLSVSLITTKGDAMLVLQKGGSTIYTSLVGKGGIYKYSTNIGEFSVIIFKARVDSIIGDNVSLTDIELYSDVITVLEPGTILGDFEVANISSDEIVFKNSYPFELKDKTVILSGSMGLSLQGNMLYPYERDVKIRGVPQYIYYGKWMNITGLNYPGFYLENGTSYEELRMYFSGNGLVKTGQAIYRSKWHSGFLSFLGNTYEQIYSDNPMYITNITSDKKIILDENTTGELDNGFRIKFNKENNSNDSIILAIKKVMTEKQQKLMTAINESQGLNNSAGNTVNAGEFFPDIYYEMYTGRNGTLRKSNILSTGDRFEYWTEYSEDRMYKAIAGELESINNNSAELNIKEYEIPYEITPGRIYGEFEVENIINDTITLKNTQPLQFNLDEEKTILNGTLKIKTSSNEYLAYPES